MATAGSNILALDYNSIQTQVASILGAPVTATPSIGYNQTVQSAQVTASSSVITQDQWQRLKKVLKYTSSVPESPMSITLTPE